MNLLKPGDLVFSHRLKNIGLVLSEGSGISVYVEDRPYRIIDSRMYSAMVCGSKKTIYEYEVEKISKNLESENV